MDGHELNGILATALSRGGEYADIFIEDTIVSSMVLQDGIVSQAQQVRLYGAGIRAVQGTQSGYAYTMDLSRQALLEAARFAGSMMTASCGTTVRPVSIPVLDGQATDMLLPDRMRAILLDIENKAHALSPDIIRVKAYISQTSQDVRFAASDGTAFADRRPRTSLSVSIVMQRGAQTQMGFATKMLSQGAEFFSETTVDEVLRQAADRTAFLFDAQQTEGGEMPVVMAAGSSGILLHEAIGHAFEADFIRTGDSIFTGRLGQQVCHPGISIVDDGTQPGDAGFLRYDDEGIPGQKTLLVDRGRLNSFMYDRISARHFGVQPTGNGRRESFRCLPVPRMRSTYMLPGDASEDDIIRHVKRGIYAQSFTNGQVQIGAGDFTFFMKTGYLIEDGHLTRPLRDLNITGNGPQALRDISMVGNNLTIDHSASMCGKEGQRVPVSQGLPTVLIDKLTVG